MASYYRKFISNFSKIAAPLYKLFKKDTHFEWLDDQENIFHRWKQKLMSQHILQNSDIKRQCILSTDASNEGMGKGFARCLCQPKSQYIRENFFYQ
jgi:hypothetical protein